MFATKLTSAKEIGGCSLPANEPWLECLVCHARFEIGPMFSGCSECARQQQKAPLEVRYDYSGRNLLEPERSACGIWRWRALLPPVESSNIVSLHEGNTPLVALKSWRGPGPLYLKNESVNPTWSYKDRANSVSISMAVQFGFSNVAAISTGNHGNAAAAYSSAGGRKCVVFCHEDAPESQLALMSWYGAQVFRGGRRHELLRCLVERGGWFPDWISCPRDGIANPYGIEGFKTIAFEIYEQTGGRIPDRVFVPVGSGDGIYGIWKGFLELRQIGAAGQVPRMYACQAAGADPYARAFRAGARRLTALESANTIALSIAEKIGGEHALGIIYESGGKAISVPDEEILRMARCLAAEGFALEPASAASVACAQTLAGESASGEFWIAIGTGAVIKWPDAIRVGFAMPEKLPPDFDRVEKLELP